MSEIMSSGAFNEIPTDLRVSGSQIEVQIKGMYQSRTRSLIVAGMLNEGLATPYVPVVVPGDGSAAAALFGAGSLAHQMVTAFRQNNKTATLYVCPVPDFVGEAASQVWYIAGTAAANGILAVYVGDQRVAIPVAVGDTAAILAERITATLNLIVALPVKASSHVSDDFPATAAGFALTFKNQGMAGNGVRVRFNLAGDDGGEPLPVGVSVTAPHGESLTGGSGVPDHPAIFAALGDMVFDFIGTPYNTAADIAAFGVEMDRRWRAGVEIYGTVYTARSGSLSELLTFGEKRNEKTVSCLGTYGHQSPDYRTAARYLGQCAAALANHEARPLATLPLIGEMGAPETEQFKSNDKNALLWSGISVCDTDQSGVVKINRAVTMYQRNATGQPDNAWLDVTSPATLTRIARELKYLLEAIRATRPLVVDDGTPIDPAIPHITPRLVLGLAIALYQSLMYRGFVEREKEARKRMLCGRAPDDPTRINLLYTPDLANPLYIFAAQVTASLQWSETTV